MTILNEIFCKRLCHARNSNDLPFFVLAVLQPILLSIAKTMGVTTGLDFIPDLGSSQRLLDSCVHFFSVKKFWEFE